MANEPGNKNTPVKKTHNNNNNNNIRKDQYLRDTKDNIIGNKLRSKKILNELETPWN